MIGAVPIERSEWGACIFVGSTVILVAFALKFIPAEWIGILDAGAIGLDEDNETKNQIVDAYGQYATRDVGEFVPTKGESAEGQATDNYTPAEGDKNQ